MFGAAAAAVETHLGVGNGWQQRTASRIVEETGVSTSAFADHYQCRSCSHRDLELIVDLGAQPLANSFLNNGIINDILTRITLVGALYLFVIYLIPTWMLSGLRLDKLWLIGGLFENLPTAFIHGLNVSFYFGGTSLLIVVGVAMDTINQVESRLIMRHYEGFSPRSGRIRGRKTW